MKLSKIKPNPDNPRVLRDGKFKKLVASLREFPEMMEKRPIVVDEGGIILGGNMRYRALQDIYGKKGEIPDEWVTVAKGWTEEQKREFVVKDNSSFGELDWDALVNEWDAQQLADWGIDFPEDWAKAGEGDNDDEDGDDGDDKDGDGGEGGNEEEGGEQAAVLDVLFPTDNDYEVPTLLPNLQGGRVELPITPWGANSRLNKDVATYHFYVDDYRFEALFKDPLKLVASGCKSIVEPNCSLHDQTPIAFGLQLIYKKRWIARYMQELGVKVYVDLNVSRKFAEWNLLGVPDGWNAFFTRGLTDMVGLLEIDLAVARNVSGKDTPNLIVYGGGRKAEEFCQRNGLLYVTDFINNKKITKNKGE